MSVIEGNAVILEATETGKKRRTYSLDERARYITEYMRSGQSVEEFASDKGISRSTLYWWLRSYVKEDGLWKYQDHAVPAENDISERIEEINESGKASVRRRRTAAEKKELLERFERSGMPLYAFAKQNDLNYASLREWRRRYREEGKNGLKSKKLRSIEAGKRSRLSEPEFRQQIRILRIRILELEIRLIKLEEKINKKRDEGRCEQND